MHCSAGAALTQVLGGLDLQEVVSQSEGWTSASRVWPGLSEASLLGSRSFLLRVLAWPLLCGHTPCYLVLLGWDPPHDLILLYAFKDLGSKIPSPLWH